MSKNNTKKINNLNNNTKRVIIQDTSKTVDKIELHPFEIAKMFGAIPMGNVDYYTAKTLYNKPGFKEQKQKEMDDYFKNKELQEQKLKDDKK